MVARSRAWIAHEVDTETIDRRPELRDAVKPRLATARAYRIVDRKDVKASQSQAKGAG